MICVGVIFFFFFKQKTAYEVRISDWSSDVCSSDLSARANSELPEQSAWWEGMAKLYDGEPTFTESSDVTEWMGGGSDDAGFVQVMKSTGEIGRELCRGRVGQCV